MAATRFRKEVPAVHMRDHAAYIRKKKGEKPKSPNADEYAVRAAMGPHTTSSRASAERIQGKVAELRGRVVPVDTIHKHLKSIRREKKRGTL
jgi:hypothetical protein